MGQRTHATDEQLTLIRAHTPEALTKASGLHKNTVCRVLAGSSATHATIAVLVTAAKELSGGAQ